MMHFLPWVAAQQIQVVKITKQAQLHAKKNERRRNDAKVLR
jgi:hypothetical protein